MNQMSSGVRYFTKDNGVKLPVSDAFLIPFLTPTSPGTQYWEPPPPDNVEALRREDGRVLLQLHQVIDLLRRCGVELKNRTLLDIGTGNGMIPRLILQYSDLSRAVGVDPYLDGEHLSSWQAHDHGELFKDLTGFIDKHCPDALDYDQYKHMVGYQDFSIRPAKVPLTHQGRKEFRFEQIGAHDLHKLNEKFDIFYAKAIDHIPDWPGIFKAIDAAASDDAVIVIKHFSFFSFLGPHRYATTNIPWGHLLMSDAEYRRFAEEFHGHRAKDMVDFYFNGLAYPRAPMSDMMMMAQNNGFEMFAVINEPMRHIGRAQKLIGLIPDFWRLIHANWPSVSAEEMFSGRYHIVFKRAPKG